MWICSRCQTANKDGHSQCVQCSAPRNARRFGAGTPVVAPSVQTVSPERRMQPPLEEAPAPETSRRQPAARPPVNQQQPSGGLVRLVGRLLSILLPLLVLLLAVLRIDLLKPVIEELFWGKAPATALAPLVEGTAAVAGGLRPVLVWVAYVCTALVAALAAAAPGLGLYALGHLCRGIRRR